MARPQPFINLLILQGLHQSLSREPEESSRQCVLPDTVKRGDPHVGHAMLRTASRHRSARFPTQRQRNRSIMGQCNDETLTPPYLLRTSWATTLLSRVLSAERSTSLQLFVRSVAGSVPAQIPSVGNPGPWLQAEHEAQESPTLNGLRAARMRVDHLGEPNARQCNQRVLARR